MSNQENLKNQDDPGQESFRKGNINFDLLEPEFPAGRHHAKSLKGEIHSKRGIFDRNLKVKPVGIIQISFWLFLFITSFSLFVMVLFIARSLFWILALPLILISLLWSFIMLVLFKVRPR